MRHIWLQSKQGLFNQERQIYKHSMNRVDIIGSWRQSRPQWLSPILSKGIIKPPPKKNLNKKKKEKQSIPPPFFLFSDKDGQITGLHVSSRNFAQAPGGRGKASDLYLRVQNFSRRRMFKTLTPSLTRRKRQKKQTTTKKKTTFWVSHREARRSSYQLGRRGSWL